jgi:phosphoadenosine phosphosulfate reductase
VVVTSIASAIPEETDATAADAARRVVEAAQGDHVLALVSGGHDSLTAMHVAYHAAPWSLDGIVHVNTGIGIPETRQFVRQRARDLSLDYYEVGRPEPNGGGHEYRLRTEEYDQWVQERGFPGPAAHFYQYTNLKEKPLDRFFRDYRVDRDELTLVSGVRQHESDRRMENVADSGRDDFLGIETISPLVEFRGIDVRRYRRVLDLPMNPVVEKLEMSGECLCGSFAGRGERRMLKLFYPEVHRRLLCLEAKVAAAAALDDGPDEQYTRWGHSQYRDRERDAMDDDNQMLLCSSCERQAECQSNSDDDDGDGDGGGCS